MRKSCEKCLLEMTERERTKPILMERIIGIKNNLRRAAGVLKSITDERYQRNPRYYNSLIQGWQEQLNLLAMELTLLHAELSKHM